MSEATKKRSEPRVPFDQRALLRPCEAAEYLGTSTEGLEKLIVQGHFDSTGVGKSRRFFRKTLDDYVRRLRTKR